MTRNLAYRAILAAIFALTTYRVVLTLFDQTELSTDEAQYWFWGQSFDFGNYSKPPLIGWILGVSTELWGQSVAAVRVPAGILQGATALLVFHIAAQLASPQVAIIAALSYLTTPAVALGSAVMTTDTPMLLAAAIALVAQLHLAKARLAGQRATGLALLLGVGLGLGVLAKHAMLFWLVGAMIAAWASPHLRIRANDAALAVVVMLALTLPHVLWLARNDFVTLQHIRDITEGEGLSVVRPLLFLAQQGIVMGPILFAALVLAIATRRKGDGSAALAPLVLVPILIVLVQAMQGPALANWAVLYLVPGSVLAALWLVGHPRLAGASLALGLVVSLALPLVKVFGTGLARPDGSPLLARYLGHGAVAEWAIATAQAAGAGTLVADGRNIMADLSWFGADAGLAIRAVPPGGQPSHHWEATAPFRAKADPGPVYLLWTNGHPMPCRGAVEVSRLDAPPGAYGGRSFVMLRIETPDCLSAQGAAHG